MTCLTGDQDIQEPNSPLVSPHVRESGFQNQGDFCWWNPESWKVLLVESAILSLFPWNAEYSCRNPESPNPSTTEKRSGIQ